MRRYSNSKQSGDVVRGDVLNPENKIKNVAQASRTAPRLNAISGSSGDIVDADLYRQKV